MDQNRVPAGLPGGGQWAKRYQSESEARLSSEREYVEAALVDGTVLPIPAALGDRFRGVTEDGYLVIADEMLSTPEHEYLVGLTPCCNETAKGLESGIGCRRCYRDVDPLLGGPVSVAVPAVR